MLNTIRKYSNPIGLLLIKMEDRLITLQKEIVEDFGVIRQNLYPQITDIEKKIKTFRRKQVAISGNSMGEFC